MREDEELWVFTLSFYARPGVAESCLRLQEEAGVDVNLLLTGLWLGLAGRGALRPDWQADATLRSWREEVIQPLRGLRRLLKGKGEDDFREDLRRLELASERIYQRKLLGALTAECLPPSGPVEDATRNLHLLGGGGSPLLHQRLQEWPVRSSDSPPSHVVSQNP